MILSDNELVWYANWPQNIYRSQTYFHGSVILLYIFNTLRCTNVFLVWIISEHGTMFDPKLNVSHFDIYFVVLWFWHILKTIGSSNIMLCDYETVRSSVLPQNKFRSLWPISHGSVILLYFQNHLGPVLIKCLQLFLS